MPAELSPLFALCLLLLRFVTGGLDVSDVGKLLFEVGMRTGKISTDAIASMKQRLFPVRCL
jgi:hypothetical protein